MINDDNNSSGGNRGKWTDRIKKIRRDRLKNIKNITFFDNDNLMLLKLGKIFLALPSVIYTNIKSDDNKKTSLDVENNKVEILGKSSNLHNKKKYIVNSDNLLCKDKIIDVNKNNKLDEIRKIDISYLKRNSIKPTLFNNNQNIKLQLEKEKLQKEIVDLIKKKLVKNINELEILQSEFYVISMIDFSDIYLEQCNQDIKEIKKLFSKVKSLKEKYDYLKDNIDFQYMLEFDDDLLIDKILELKNMYNNIDVSKTVNDYKLLNEFKYLYLKIDKLEENTFRLAKYKEDKLIELKKRDIDFDKFKDKLYDFDKISDEYNNFVSEQEFFLNQLEEKISYIDKQEKITYRLKGFNELLGNSFKYIGLLLLNPLKGLIPGIVSQTLLTRNVIHNLYTNMEWEESRKFVYDAIDYSSSINAAINNLDDTSRLVDSTLEEIIMLKKKFKQEFSKYETSFSSYKDAISKLNKIENAVLGSKIKIGIMQEKMKEKERVNSDKLCKVRELNNLN